MSVFTVDVSTNQFNAIKAMQQACRLKTENEVISLAHQTYINTADEVLSSPDPANPFIFIRYNQTTHSHKVIPLSGVATFFTTLPAKNDIAANYYLLTTRDSEKATRHVMAKIGMADMREFFGEAMNFFGACLYALNDKDIIGIYNRREGQFKSVNIPSFAGLDRK